MDIECRTRRATCDDGEDDTEMLTSGCDCDVGWELV